jgi:hypothetical protein
MGMVINQYEVILAGQKSGVHPEKRNTGTESGSAGDAC